MNEAFPLDLDVLLSVLDHLNLAVYITDLDRRIVLWNRKAEEITGYRAEDVVGRACRDQLLSHTDKDGHILCSTQLCPLHRSMQLGKESDQPLLVYARTAHDRRIAVSVSVAPLRDASGAVVGGIEVFRDETEQIEDLEFAKKIQRYLLPAGLPSLPGIEFDVCYYPHDLIGGDFYDVRRLDSSRCGILVADVRGHGVSAALYTMWLKSLEEGLSELASDPAAFLAGMNRELARFVVTESFATAFYGVVDAERYELMFANAGHPCPLHFHGDGREPTEIEATGMPLGIIADEEYETAAVSLEPGDVAVCYTDGASEVNDREGKMLGAAGLTALVGEGLAQGQGRLLESVYRRIKDLCGDVSLADDVLLLSLSRQAST